MDATGLKSAAKCAAVFGSHQTAENAVKELSRAGFDIAKLSIIGRDYHTDEHIVGFYNGKDRVRHWGKLGAFWGSLFGILFAPAFFIIPGMGPILIGGFFGSALMGMIEGGVVGAAAGGTMTAFGAALWSIGIPKDSVLNYEQALKADKFLLLVHGTPDEVAKAHELLVSTADSVEIHPAS